MKWLSAIGDLFNIGKTALEGWQTRKKAKLDSDLRVNEAKTKAKITRLETGQKADIAWETTSIENSGWKDEWFTIVFSIPLIMCFVPGLVDYVQAGFMALKETPDWYQWTIGILVSSSVGYKKLADFMKLRKGD